MVESESRLEMGELQEVLLNVRPMGGQQLDEVIWTYDMNKVYIVRPCYGKFMQVQQSDVVDIHLKNYLKFIWESSVPSKLKVFGWILVQDRLPTRKKLFKMGIIHDLEDLGYVFCLEQEEDLDHIMLHFPMVKTMWQKIQSWLEVEVPVEENFRSRFLKVVAVLSNKMSSNRAGVIWLIVCWCIWKQHNDIVFNNTN